MIERILPQPSAPGLIITAPLSAARHIQADARWLITRKNTDKAVIGITWVPELAPSQALFNRYMDEWRGTSQKYWPLYVDRFQEELKTEEKLKALRRLWRLTAQGKTVLLLCYCPRPEHCHRSLVGEFLKTHGANVQEYTPQQAGLFE